MRCIWKTIRAEKLPEDVPAPDRSRRKVYRQAAPSTPKRCLVPEERFLCLRMGMFSHLKVFCGPTLARIHIRNVRRLGKQQLLW